MKLCLDVNPPLQIMEFEHMVKFQKTSIWMGGCTVMPRYKRQG